MPIRAYLYDAEGTDHEVELDREIVSGLNHKQLLWVDLSISTEEEVRQVATSMDLPRESIAHLLNPNRRPKLYNYGNFFQLNIDTMEYKNDRFEITEVDFIAGTNIVVTAHQKPVEFLMRFDRRVMGDSQLGELDAPAFLATLLDWHISNYYRIVEQLEAEIDKLDEGALQHGKQEFLLSRLVKLRQNVSTIRRSLTPHREVYAGLVRPDLTTFSSSESTAHFKILNVRLERAIESMENVRELLVGSFEIYATQTALRTNNAIRILTVVSAVLLPAGVIAGIMGMSVKTRVYTIGEYGFWGAIGLMILIGTIMIIIARKRGWI